MNGLIFLFISLLPLLGCAESQEQTTQPTNPTLQATPVKVENKSPPPEAPRFVFQELSRANRQPIVVSPNLSVLPIAQIEFQNTKANKLAFRFPYYPEGIITQQTKAVAYQEAECEVKTTETKKEETAKARLFILRSSLLPQTITKLPTDKTAADLVTLDPQQAASITLYIAFNPNEEPLTMSGRNKTLASKDLVPGCKPGPCYERRASFTRFTWGMVPCGPGEEVAMPIYFCRVYVVGKCSRKGECNYPDLRGSLEELNCLTYYRDQLPKISFADFTEVLQTKIDLTKLFNNATVAYPDAPQSAEYATPLKSPMNELILN